MFAAATALQNRDTGTFDYRLTFKKKNALFFEGKRKIAVVENMCDTNLRSSKR